MNIKVLIATNKLYKFPEYDMYFPIQGGRAFSTPLPGIAGDDTGDNISSKNKFYCELTCLYWGWKHLDCDYIGLAHYRRHFGQQRIGKKWNRVLSQEKAEQLLSDAPIILTKKRMYFIESLYSHYGHTHNAIDLKLTRKILEEKCPEYLGSFDYMMKQSSAHMFNMFIMRKDLADAYCEWMFDILKVLEERLDISGYSDHDKRVFGRISELLLDVWIRENGINFNEIPLVFMEKQHWGKKIFYFLKSKFFSNKSL